ncbi:class I adenylate-forming enzyme family protein [Marinomonas aquiplantarum]|uniref:Long-chain acyl-CoA synthetase n=1 Tax=Marinomonas aquiplantarum TaxID=491951 RepID=A0A366D3H4_9GAMM|nr:AMP-binding protein [Marinomonas aquiplantarum]RBO84049.1 long-chain acyl-CoA synthetase [Marinomonas aquiplantarum]
MIKNLSDVITLSAEKFGDKTALIYNQQSFTYREINRLANRLASALKKKSIGPGDKVTLYGENSWQWLVSYYGILKTGAVVNPVNVMLTPNEVEFVVQDCDAKVIIASQSKGTPLVGIQQKTGVESLILYGEDIPEGAESFDHFLEQGRDDFTSFEVNTNSLSTICYTSGTTGNPKGAMLSHRSVISNFLMTAQMHGRSEKDTVVSALPCPHVYGNIVFNSTFYKGGTLVMHSLFNVEEVFTSINQYQATMFEGVPTMYLYMLDHPNLSNVDFSHMRICTVGGQTMPTSKMEAVEEAIACPLIELWGMTEIGGLGTTFAHDGEYKHGSIGVALPYTGAKIVDVDNAEVEVARGDVGELMISGPLVMQGYYGNPQATQEAITADGWLHTGDLAKMDKDNCIFVVDRKKDLIITAGFNIYPAELERVIANHPDVAMVAVGPIADEAKGELAKAYIVAKQNTTPDIDQIIAYCREHLAAYKVPRDIQFVDDLPKTSSGKVMRRKLHTLDK